LQRPTGLALPGISAGADQGRPRGAAALRRNYRKWISLKWATTTALPFGLPL